MQEGGDFFDKKRVSFFSRAVFYVTAVVFSPPGSFISFSGEPFSCVYEGFHPWGNVVFSEGIGIPCVLPGEDGTFEVGHHCEVSSVV